MGRRPSHAHPQVRLHKSGSGRVRIHNEDFWVGRFGSPEAAAEYDRLIGEWLASGKTRPPSRRGKQAEPAAHATQPTDAVDSALLAVDSLCEISPEPVDETADTELATTPSAHVDGLTVGELCTRWLDWIESTRCHNGKSATSLYYGARQAAVALEDFWDHPVAGFGSRNLLRVQQKLVHTPVISRPKDPTKPPKSKPRSRTTINDTVNRIRQMFRWVSATYVL